MIDWLAPLFTSGLISVIAIGVLWLVTFAAAKRSAKAIRTFGLLVPNAISGSALLAAFGIGIRQGHVGWLALLLTTSLIAFLVDLRLRLAVQAPGLRRRTE